MCARRPQNLDELKAYCLEEWGNIPQTTCANAVVNYKKRLLEVIGNEGHSINYLCYLEIHTSFVLCHVIQCVPELLNVYGFH